MLTKFVQCLIEKTYHGVAMRYFVGDKLGDGIIGAGCPGMTDESKSRFEQVASKFDIAGNFVRARPYGSGHINDTRLVTTVDKSGAAHRYVLQKINKNVFRRPDLLMQNYVNVTEFIRKK
jgi:hypothetical protein